MSAFAPDYIKRVVDELRSRGWKPDRHGDPDCVDEASAAGADIIDALTADVARLRAEMEQLRNAIRWALGEEGEFMPAEDEPLRPDGSPVARYWWRSELRRRAALAARGPHDAT